MDIKLLCCLYWNLYSLIFIEQSLLSAAINTDGSRSNNRTANNESQIATIIFAGDIYFDGPVKYFADVVKSCDYLMPFRMTRALLAEADLRVGNLESAFLDDNLKLKPIFANKNVHHRGSVKGAEGLKYAGFDIMQLANNHISDYGEAGVVNTVKVLQDAGIDYVGLCETYPKHRIHRNDSLRDVDRVQLGNSSWHNRNKRTGKTLKSSNFTNKKDILKIKGRGKGLKERQEPFENKNSHDYDKRARKTWKSSGSVKKKEVLRITRKGNKAHDRQKPVIKTVNGVKIGFLAYCQNQEGCGSQRCSDAEGCQAGSKHFNIGPAIFDKFIASKDLIELKESVDIAIVLMHWSRELAPVPPMGVREIAKSLVLYGADLIVGTHPHVIQVSFFYYAHTNQFCVAQKKYKAPGLKSTDRACEVWAVKPRALYFPVQRQNRSV